MPDAFWAAIGWMQMDTTYDELRYLTAMTALETLVAQALPQQSSRLVPKADFKPLESQLLDAIDHFAGLDDSTKSFFAAKVSGLNRRSLSHNIKQLFSHYELPDTDFSDDEIKKLVNLRNAIVHNGGVPDGVDVWRYIVLARELIARIVLREIGYTGPYQCYLDGQKQRVLPPPHHSHLSSA